MANNNETTENNIKCDTLIEKGLTANACDLFTFGKNPCIDCLKVKYPYLNFDMIKSYYFECNKIYIQNQLNHKFIFDHSIEKKLDIYYFDQAIGKWLKIYECDYILQKIPLTDAIVERQGLIPNNLYNYKLFIKINNCICPFEKEQIEIHKKLHINCDCEFPFDRRGTMNHRDDHCDCIVTEIEDLIQDFAFYNKLVFSVESILCTLKYLISIVNESLSSGPPYTGPRGIEELNKTGKFGNLKLFFKSMTLDDFKTLMIQIDRYEEYPEFDQYITIKWIQTFIAKDRVADLQYKLDNPTLYSNFKHERTNPQLCPNSIDYDIISSNFDLASFNTL